MNGTYQNGKNCNFKETYPGCLGKMVNLFELNIGVPANRLLTDKPHRDGSPLSRSRSDVSMMSPSGDQVEDKVIISELRNTMSNRKSNATPMKMLIAQEMSKEVDSRRSPPNLVAKLMGLDSLPQQEPDSTTQRSNSRVHPRRHSEIPMSSWEQQNGFFHHVEPNEYKDVYEIWQQSQKSTHKARLYETKNEKKLALVRQKFVEAKRMSMDERLRQSKQFQDALEVLSSNKDLFLKCLQEPNSVFSQHLHDLQSIPPPPETKRITVLKPSKVADSKGAFAHLTESPPASWKSYENPTQATRIVVLKPSPGKPHDNNDEAVGSPQSEIVHGEDFFADVEDDGNHESREVAKAITRKMRKKLGRHQRDETLISSVFSNGYVGDESSFNKSEIEYPEIGNLSDSEAAMSPVSRHSWDYVNRLGSPYSSSFSRASYSPESSVCREAKKRLSERWAMMASSNGSCQEQRHVRRSSSTLGEMLALSEAKKVVVVLPVEEKPKDLNSILVSEVRKDENVDNNNSPRNLTRSKSVPVSSTQFGTGISQEGKPEVPKEDVKTKNVKSSFKGKVSSLFFSRSKKTNKDNKSVAPETKDEFHSFPGEVCSDRTERLGDKGLDHSPSSKSSSSNLMDNQGMISPEIGLTVGKPIATRNPGENPDQPSPISVLDLPFQEDEYTAKLFLHNVQPDRHGFELSLNPIGSNLIDKSPPIGSIARTLSWEDSSSLDTASSSYPTQEKDQEEQQDWFLFVKTLLSVVGDELTNKWHSPESPLDPSLRDKYIDLKDKETLHEAKRRQKRSTRKLVFDCVNAALVEIAVYETNNKTMVEEVWARMNELFCGECECGDENSLVVERLVRKEVVGKGWNGNLQLEMDNLGKEIEVKLLEELVHETVVELTGNV